MDLFTVDQRLTEEWCDIWKAQRLISKKQVLATLILWAVSYISIGRETVSKQQSPQEQRSHCIHPFQKNLQSIRTAPKLFAKNEKCNVVSEIFQLYL